MTPMDNAHANDNSASLTQVLPLPATLVLELPMLPTVELPCNESFDYSSLTCDSASMPPMDDVHANATSSVPTQSAAAHVPQLPTAALRELPVLTPARRPKIETNALR